MDRDETALDGIEFRFKALFTGINHYAALCAENDFFDHDKAIQVGLVHLVSKNFINLILIDKGYAVNSVAQNAWPVMQKWRSCSRNRGISHFPCYHKRPK